MNIKHLIFFLIALSPLTAFSEIIGERTAYEAEAIKVEYYETSDSGIVTPINCTHCTSKQYKFSGQPIIKKNGQVIKFSEFMKEYWNAKGPTIFLDPSNGEVVRIIY